MVSIRSQSVKKVKSWTNLLAQKLANTSRILGKPETWVANVTTFAGRNKGLSACGHVDGEKDMAQFCFPSGLVMGANGTLYVTDWGSHSIRCIENNHVRTLNAMDSTEKSLHLSNPHSIRLDERSHIFITDSANHRIVKIKSDGTLLDTLNTLVYSPHGLVLAQDGSIYVSCLEWGVPAIKKINKDGQYILWAGGKEEGFLDGKGSQARIRICQGMVFDSKDNLYFADTGNHSIRKITPTGHVITVAGDGGAGMVNGSTQRAKFNKPTDLIFDRDENLYIADAGNHCIRILTPNGRVLTLAGNGMPGLNNGLDVDARFNYPWGLALDAVGRLYVADRFNHCIRVIDIH